MKYHIYGPTGPTRIVTYCTPIGSGRLSKRDGMVLIEFSGMEPFVISADGVEALMDALERLTEEE